MTFLIDKHTQNQIANLIDNAVAQVLGELTSHGNEEGLTAALGHALMRRTIQSSDLQVNFRYRQHNKITEEKYSGADGSFLVRVVTPDGSVEKASLFQAKLLRGDGDVRALGISSSDAARLQKQSNAMLHNTRDAVAVFYTYKNIYVVDAEDYRGGGPLSKKPLSQDHRLITLGTYLGRWMPRCTKGDEDASLVTRSRHLDGFQSGLSLNIVSQRPSVPWEADRAEDDWRRKR